VRRKHKADAVFSKR